MAITSFTRSRFVFVTTLGASLWLTGCASSEKSGPPASSASSSQYQEMPTAAQTSEPLPAAAPASSAPVATEPTPANLVDYTIKQGDSLWLIAHQHHTSVAKLKAWNSLTTDVIHPGKTLKVPPIQ